jgi:hypothetical protein
VVRGHQRFDVQAADYDNPFLSYHLEVQSGGTRSAGTAVPVKLDFTSAQWRSSSTPSWAVSPRSGSPT